MNSVNLLTLFQTLDKEITVPAECVADKFGLETIAVHQRTLAQKFIVDGSVFKSQLTFGT